MDSHIYGSYKVPPYYDSLLAKIISYGENRQIAIARMQTALEEIVIEGIKTNIPLLQDVLRDANFVRGGVNIHYLEEQLLRK